MLCTADIAALALACAPYVASETAIALVKQESGGNPFAIGTGRHAALSHQPRTKEHALHVATVLQKAGIDFDVGAAQIRTTNLRRLGVTVEHALDPCVNLQLMQSILLDNYRRALASGHRPGDDASRASLSAYNTGSLSAGFKNGYVAQVVARHGAVTRRPHHTPGKETQ